MLWIKITVNDKKLLTGLGPAQLLEHTVDHDEVLLLLEPLQHAHTRDVLQTLLQLLHLVLEIFNLNRKYVSSLLNQY